MLGKGKPWVDMVSSGRHGCEPICRMFWSARLQTSGMEGRQKGEPDTEKGRKKEERYRLVRATAALSREREWALQEGLSSGL